MAGQYASSLSFRCRVQGRKEELALSAAAAVYRFNCQQQHLCTCALFCLTFGSAAVVSLSGREHESKSSDLIKLVDCERSIGRSRPVGRQQQQQLLPQQQNLGRSAAVCCSQAVSEIRQVKLRRYDNCTTWNDTQDDVSNQRQVDDIGQCLNTSVISKR